MAWPDDLPPLDRLPAVTIDLIIPDTSTIIVQSHYLQPISYSTTTHITSLTTTTYHYPSSYCLDCHLLPSHYNPDDSLTTGPLPTALFTAPLYVHSATACSYGYQEKAGIVLLEGVDEAACSLH